LGLGLVIPLIVPGTGGTEVIVIASVDGLLVPQALTEATVILPEVLPKVTEILFVPVPEVIVAPAGSAHEYETAPLTGTTE
jgi:hypothetical protein